MIRVLAAGIGVIGCSALLIACSDHKSSTSTTPAASSASAGTSLSTGGKTAVKVDGSDLQGLDLSTVTCVKQGGKINVASGAVGGQQGLGVVMTDEATPKVQSLGMVVDGNALAVGHEDRFGRREGGRQHLHDHR